MIAAGTVQGRGPAVLAGAEKGHFRHPRRGAAACRTHGCNYSSWVPIWQSYTCLLYQRLTYPQTGAVWALERRFGTVLGYQPVPFECGPDRQDGVDELRDSGCVGRDQML